jgi:3' exoribonuclease, RNase T-like
LRHAYEACGIKAPWSYRYDFCYRTMYRNFPSAEPYRAEGVKHNALDDARSQAKHLISIMKRLKGAA